MGDWTSQGRTRQAIARISLLALCALALVFTALVGSQPARASAAGERFYGVSLLPADTATATATDTPLATATDTATPTDTPAPAATDTPTATATATPAPTATPSGPIKALNISAAVAEAGWPQSYSNWCGIATIAAIAHYISPGSPVSQTGIAAALNDPDNASMWGTPSQSSPYAPYLAADIARDFGTDPRSLAEGLTLATGHTYHAVVDTHGAWDTTVQIVNDVLRYRQPVSVIVDHGQHSVLVSGVDATDDPLTNPRSITAIHVWDPGGGVAYVGIQPQMFMKVPISLWLSGVTNYTNFYGSTYFKYPYAANVLNGVALDPDPAVGPYTYIPAKYNHLWIGHYVYISPRGAQSVSADWEYNQSGALLAGFATSKFAALPDGYSGPWVLMPTNPPPPPPPVRPVKLAPPAPKPHPKPKPTPTPQPTPRRLPPTPSSSMPSDPPPPVDPPQAACAPVMCALASMASAPALPLGGLLLTGLLLLGVAWYRPRRARRGQPAAIAPAEANAPLTPPLADLGADRAASADADAAGVERDAVAATPEATAPEAAPEEEPPVEVAERPAPAAPEAPAAPAAPEAPEAPEAPDAAPALKEPAAPEPAAPESEPGSEPGAEQGGR